MKIEFMTRLLTIRNIKKRTRLLNHRIWQNVKEYNECEESTHQQQQQQQQQIPRSQSSPKAAFNRRKLFRNKQIYGTFSMAWMREMVLALLAVLHKYRKRASAREPAFTNEKKTEQQKTKI